MVEESTSFLDIVDRADALLAGRSRISLRGLRRELALSEPAFEDLVVELVAGRQVATRDGDALVVRARNASNDPETSASSPPHRVDVGERRQLTVMFCDLVGSTGLSQRVDPEEFGEILREYRAICVEATKRFDGHVAQYLGDGVMMYFGFPQAHEDDAGRAIRAGLEIQRVLRERPDPQGVDARIGIHTGLVVVEPSSGGDDALALGATSNVAARIENVAKPGAVVVSEATLALCRGVFITHSLGEVALKGVDAPILLHEVERGAGVRSALATDAANPMMGRDREVALLLERWEEAKQGRGQVVLVSGEPGMGKSRLLQALHEELSDSEHVWLDMQCSPFAAGSAFQPLVDLFNTGLMFEADDSPEGTSQLLVNGLETLPGLPSQKVIPYLLPLLSLPPSTRYPLPQTSAEQQRERTLAALVQLNLTLAEQQPVVLVVEDLHWSDPSTREYLSRVVQVASDARLLLVLTFRPEFEVSFAAAHVTELELTRLSRRVTREMIVGVVGGRLPEPVLSELEVRSDGVPLFIEELASGVQSSGILTERDGRYELRGNLKDLAIPATLQDSLMGRLDRLSSSKHVAQQAATLGRDFSYRLIEVVTDVSAPALRQSLDQLVAAGILHRSGTPPDETYRFKHALLRDTAYESQLRSTRKVLHGKVAAALEEHFAKRVESEPELMARHCAAAGAHAKAVDHYQRAAELAITRLSNLEALEHYSLALEALALLPASAERVQREIALRVPRGKALMAMRGYAAPEGRQEFARVEELCESLGDGPERLTALIGLVEFDVTQGHLEKYRGHAERILRIAEPLGVRELVVMSHVLMGAALVTTASELEAERTLAAALAIAKTVDFPAPATPYDNDLICIAHTTHAVARVICARLDQALESGRLAQARANAIEHTCTRCYAAADLAIAGFLMDDPEWTRALADEALAIGEDRGFHSADLLATVMRGWSRARCGEIDAGVSDIEHGMGLIASTGSVAGLPMLYVAAADTYRIAGQRDRALAFVELADRTLERTGERGYAVYTLFAAAMIELELGGGDVSESERCFLAAFERAEAFDHRYHAMKASTWLARLALQSGRLREAHDRLATCCARLTEGFERDAAREASAALAELAGHLDTNARAS